MDSLSLQRIRIPSILAVIMVAVMMTGIIAGTKNIGQIKKLFSSADAGSAPSGPVEIASVSDSSFTVFWTTDTRSAGAVFFGKTPALSDGVAVDDRDLTDPNGKYTTHFVRVSNLSEKTKYYFKVGATDPSYGDPNNNQSPFEITTGPRIASIPATDPIFGKANKPSGVPAAGAIVVWQTTGAGKLASLVKADGTYVIPVATARSSNLNSFFTLNSGADEQISLNLAAEGSSSIRCTYGADKPLPTVKLGENADCSKNNANNDTPTVPPPATPNGDSKTTNTDTTTAHFSVPTKTATFPTNSTTGTTDKINIVSGQSVSTPFPTISGKVGPRQMVKITIHSETPYSGTVIAGADGSWSWTPPAGLAPGEHTVTMTIINSDGTTQTVTRNFTVNSGEPILPLTSGTPSATATHFACVQNACTSVDGTGVDSCSTNTDCATATPPVTGSDGSTTLMIILGALFILLSGGFVISSL